LNALAHIQSRFGIGDGAPSPVEIRLSRHGGLTRLWAELGYRHGVEVGTEQGRFAEEICKHNPGVNLFCVDPYQAYDRYEQHQTQERLDRFYGEAQTRLAPYGVTFINFPSLEAAKTFEDGRLDFVFIDANHAYEFVKADIEAWAPKVRAGGMVCGHDYKHEGQERKPLPFGVIQAVNEYTAAHGIAPWFVLKGDRCPTWAWVKS
jgi:hypothetical protein